MSSPQSQHRQSASKIFLQNAQYYFQKAGIQDARIIALIHNIKVTSVIIILKPNASMSKGPDSGLAKDTLSGHIFRLEQEIVNLLQDCNIEFGRCEFNILKGNIKEVLFQNSVRPDELEILTRYFTPYSGRPCHGCALEQGPSGVAAEF